MEGHHLRDLLVNSLRAAVHSLKGDVENALSYLRESWGAGTEVEARQNLVEAGERLEEIVQRISKIVHIS